MVRLRRSSFLTLAGVAASLCLATPPVSAEPVHSLRLPAPLAELAEVAEIDGDRPAARIVDDIIRAIHTLGPGISRSLDERRDRVRAWLEGLPASTPGPEGALVPSPLPGDCWRAALGMAGSTDEQTVVRLLSTREFALVYYALLRATPGLRAFLADKPELVAALAHAHAGVLAAFPRAVDVVDGRVVLPGGESLAKFWEALVVAPAADPATFLFAVQGRADGRIAFLLDTLARLDPARRRFALSEGIQDQTARLDDLRSLAEVFVGTHREWRPAERPFWRLRVDPLIVLASLHVDEEGRLVGPKRRDFWARVIEGRRPPEDATEPEGEAPPVTAGWLVGRVIAGGDLGSQLHLGAVTFTQRLLQTYAGATLSAVAAAGGAFVDLPALMLTLERIGVADMGIYVAGAEAARFVSERTLTPEVESALITVQASVAIIDRAVARRSLGPGEASALLEELFALRQLDQAAGRRALGRWVAARLVPVLANAGDRSRDAEAIVLDAVAGFGSRHPDDPMPVFTLDGEPYRVDLGRAERERLDAVRRRQRSVRLGVALQLAVGADELGAARSVEEFGRAVRGVIDTLEAAMSPRGSRGSGDALEERLQQVRSLFEALGRGARGGDLRRALRELATAADWAVADALRGIVYALSLGDPGGVVTLAPDVSRRHDLGVGRVPGPALSAWSLPDQSRDDRQVWFVRGALLGLEAALPGLAVRSLSATADAPALFIYEIARRQLALTVAIANPFDVTDDHRNRLVEAVRLGAQRVTTLCEPGQPPLDDLADGLTWAHVEWTCAHDRSALSRLLTLDRVAALGDDAGATGAFDALGTAHDLIAGPFRLIWPRASSLLRASGRIVDGLFVSTVAAPSIRVARALAERELPGALLPAVLALFVADLIRDAPVSFEADAFGLALGAVEFPDERFDNYLASLAAGGPIVPAPPPANPTR